MSTRKPILVTGGPRTGTTWVGRVIAKDNSVHYIHEPFNIGNRRCTCGFKVDHWFHFVCSQNDSDSITHFTHLLGSPLHRYNLLNLVQDLGSQRNQMANLRTLKKFAGSLFKPKTLLKDPLAVFSAEWLASTSNMDVLVMIRHPASFVSSYKSRNWSHPMSHFLEQPLLMRKYLSPFEEEIRDHEANEHDIAAQVALLWKFIHFMILIYQNAHPNWIFVRYEDLVLNPMMGFQKIFAQLGLTFSAKIIKMIEETSNPRNPMDPEMPYSIKQNSVENLWKWKNRLSSQEIDKIRTVVVGIVGEFYTEESWVDPQAIAEKVQSTRVSM